MIQVESQLVIYLYYTVSFLVSWRSLETRLCNAEDSSVARKSFQISALSIGIPFFGVVIFLVERGEIELIFFNSTEYYFL